MTRLAGWTRIEREGGKETIVQHSLLLQMNVSNTQYVVIWYRNGSKCTRILVVHAIPRLVGLRRISCVRTDMEASCSYLGMYVLLYRLCTTVRVVSEKPTKVQKGFFVKVTQVGYKRLFSSTPKKIKRNAPKLETSIIHY